MKREHRAYALKAARADHRLRSADSFLRRFEQQPHLAPPQAARLLKQLRGAKLNRHMRVVPARVHNAGHC
jgi:hypothetical protein